MSDCGTFSPYESGDLNAIIGGDFSLNPWQRGTSFTSLAASTYSADRWKLLNTTDAVVNVTKAADAPTAAQSGILSSHSLKLAVTTADASIAIGQYLAFSQPIEGYNFAALAQNPMTLTFWVKAHRTGTYCVAFRNSGVDRSYVAEYSVISADTWELKVVVIPASPSAGTWDYTTGIGLDVNFTQACGSTFQTTAGAWQTGNFLGTSNQTNGVAALTDTFQIDLVCLRTAGFVTPFPRRSFQQEVTLCQRYYEKSFALGTAPATAVASYTNTSFAQQPTAAGTVMMPVAFAVPKRAAPTITLYNPTSANAQAYNSSRSLDCSSTTADLVGTRSMRLFATPPGGAATGDHVAVNWAADCEL